MEYIVFCHEHFTPLGIIRSLGENGIKPIAVIVRNKFPIASKSKFIKKLFFVDSIDEGYKLIIEKLVVQDKKTFILNGEDAIESYLDLHYDELKEHFIFFNAGKQGRITHYMNKNIQNELALKYGLNVPITRIVEKGYKNNDIEFPIITKSINSLSTGWKNNSFICYNQKELDEAYRKIEEEKIMIQHYVDKKDEKSIQAFSINKGRDVFYDFMTSQLYCVNGSYSEYGIINNVNDILLKERITAILTEIGFEGIFEVEFLVDKNGKYWFLEFNFRNSGWAYASTTVGMPLPVLWCQSMISCEIPDIYYKKIHENFYVINEFRDFKLRVSSKEISIIKWLKQYRKAECKYILGKHDIKPWLSYFQNGLKRIIHK